MVGPAVDRISRDEAQKVELRPAQLGERFGPQSATFWFRIRATVPDGWRGQRVELLSLTQVARLNAGSRLFEFHTTIGWHEEHVLLKVCFPLAVRSKTASYEIPFGLRGDEILAVKLA